MASGLPRRRFLGAAGSLALAGLSGCALPRGSAWPVQGAEKGTLRILFYTDVHAQLERDAPVGMARAAAAMNVEPADLVLVGGDLIQGGLASTEAAMAPRWDAYMAMQRAIRGEVHAAIGNHDLVAALPLDGSPPSVDPRATFRDRLGLERTYYAFDALGYHFVVLDSIEFVGGEQMYRGFVRPAQIDWLTADLARLAKGTPIVCLLHMPMLTGFFGATEGATAPAPANRVLVNSREVLKLFRGHNLLLVLQGHLHVKELIRWRETVFLTGGAVCGRWWRGSWRGTEEGFNRLTLHRDRIEWDYVDYGWQAQAA